MTKRAIYMTKKAIYMTKNSQSLSAVTCFSSRAQNTVLAGIPVRTHLLP